MVENPGADLEEVEEVLDSGKGRVGPGWARMTAGAHTGCEGRL